MRQLRNILLLLLFSLLIFEAKPVHAEELYGGVDGGLTWSIDENGTLLITGSGTYYGYNEDKEDPSYGKMDHYELNNIPMWCLEDYSPFTKSVVVKADNLTHLNSFFAGLTNLTSIDLEGVDLSTVTSMQGTFAGCHSLESLDLSGLNLGPVTNASGLVFSCDNLKEVNLGNLATSGTLTNIQSMFNGCRALEYLDLNDMDVSHVTNPNQIFQSCKSLKELHIEDWDISSAETLYSIFQGCSSLEELDISKWNTTNVTDMQLLFYDCSALKKIDVSSFDVSNVTFFNGTFGHCSSLKEIDLSSWNVKSVVSFDGMFAYCENLEKVNLSGWNLKNTISMDGMFKECSSLKELSPITLYNASIYDMFVDCHALNGDITILGNTSGYAGCFRGTSSNPDAETVVTYGENCTEEHCRKIIATKTEADHVRMKAIETESAPEENENIIEKPSIVEITGFEKIVCTADGIKVTWKSVSGADRLVLQRSSDGGKTYKKLVSYNKNRKGTYLDKKVVNGKKYDYRLIAYKGNREIKTLKGRYAYLTPVRIKFTSVRCDSNGIHIDSKTNPYADAYMGYYKDGDSYVSVSLSKKPEILYPEKPVNGKKYVFRIAPCMLEKETGQYYIGPKSSPHTFYYLSPAKISAASKTSSKKYKLTWEKNTKATGYELQYSANSNMKKAKKLNIKGAKNITRTISKPSANKKYYVRVRSYIKVGKRTWYSDWSEIKVI